MKKIVQILKMFYYAFKMPLKMFFYAFKKPEVIEIKKGYKRYEYNPQTGKVRQLVPDENGYSFESKDCLYGNARSAYEFRNMLKARGYKVK